MAGTNSVRPFRQQASKEKGLSQDEEPNDVLITVDGEMLPKDVVERDAETARIDVEDDEGEDGGGSGGSTC